MVKSITKNFTTWWRKYHDDDHHDHDDVNINAKLKAQFCWRWIIPLWLKLNLCRMYLFQASQILYDFGTLTLVLISISLALVGWLSCKDPTIRQVCWAESPTWRGQWRCRWWLHTWPGWSPPPPSWCGQCCPLERTPCRETFILLVWNIQEYGKLKGTSTLATLIL